MDGYDLIIDATLMCYILHHAIFFSQMKWGAKAEYKYTSVKCAHILLIKLIYQ